MMNFLITFVKYIVVVGILVTTVVNATAVPLSMKTVKSMNNYFDQYGRVHNKPVTEERNVPTNNGWIFTAYFVKAGGEVNSSSALRIGYNQCLNLAGKFFFRSPDKFFPPVSRDEILGVAGLKLLKSEHLNGWNFSPYLVPKFNLIELVKQIIEVRGKHRNYFWQNNLDQLYRFAFSVPITDRHFILKKWGKFKWYNPTHLFYAAVAKIDELVGGESGIRYLKYSKSKEAMLKEFPENHPIRSL
jgi:hypothetical protein